MPERDDYGRSIANILGSRMRFLRKSRNIPIDDLCAVLDVTAMQYNRYERGENLLSVVGLMRIADYYDVSLAFLMNEQFDTLSKPTLFKLQVLDDQKELSDIPGRMQVFDENDSLTLVKSASTYYVFESIQDTAFADGVYKFELKEDGNKRVLYMAKVYIPGSESGRPDTVFVDFEKSNVRPIKRDDIFFIGKIGRASCRERV